MNGSRTYMYGVRTWYYVGKYPAPRYIARIGESASYRTCMPSTGQKQKEPEAVSIEMRYKPISSHALRTLSSNARMDVGYVLLTLQRLCRERNSTTAHGTKLGGPDGSPPAARGSPGLLGAVETNTSSSRLLLGPLRFPHGTVYFTCTTSYMYMYICSTYVRSTEYIYLTQAQPAPGRPHSAVGAPYGVLGGLDAW